MNAVRDIQLTGQLIQLYEEYLLFDGDLLTEEEIEIMSMRRNWLVNRELFKEIEKERIG